MWGDIDISRTGCPFDLKISGIVYYPLFYTLNYSDFIRSNTWLSQHPNQLILVQKKPKYRKSALIYEKNMFYMFMAVHCIEMALNFTIANRSSEISATMRDIIFDRKFNMVTYIGSNLSNCSFFIIFCEKTLNHSI